MNAVELAELRHRQALENRANMPLCAEMLQQARDVFGPGCKLTFGKEGERRLGHQHPSVPLTPLVELKKKGKA